MGNFNFLYNKQTKAIEYFSIKDFYNDCQSDLKGLINEIRKYHKNPKLIRSWEESLPVLANLLYDPKKYLNDVIDEMNNGLKKIEDSINSIDLIETNCNELISKEEIKELDKVRKELEIIKEKTYKKRIKELKKLTTKKFNDKLLIQIEREIRKTNGKLGSIDLLLSYCDNHNLFLKGDSQNIEKEGNNVVIELKGWRQNRISKKEENVKAIDSVVIVERLKNGNSYESLHPIKQAKEYKESLLKEIQNNDSLFSADSILPLAYLYNIDYEGCFLFDDSTTGTYSRGRSNTVISKIYNHLYKSPKTNKSTSNITIYKNIDYKNIAKSLQKKNRYCFFASKSEMLLFEKYLKKNKIKLSNYLNKQLFFISGQEMKKYDEVICVANKISDTSRLIENCKKLTIYTNDKNTINNLKVIGKKYQKSIEEI